MHIVFKEVKAMPEYLTPPQAGKFLKSSVSKLAKDRCTKELGIPYFKNGRTVLYAKEDLERWLEDHRFNSTSEYSTTPGPGRPKK